MCFILVFFSLVMYSPFCFPILRSAKMLWFQSITISWIHWMLLGMTTKELWWWSEILFGAWYVNVIFKKILPTSDCLCPLCSGREKVFLKFSFIFCLMIIMILQLHAVGLHKAIVFIDWMRVLLFYSFSLIMPIMLWLKTQQPRVRFVIHHALTTT